MMKRGVIGREKKIDLCVSNKQSFTVCRIKIITKIMKNGWSAIKL